MKQLKMQLFGCFSLSDGQHILDEEKLHSNKVTLLLVYLLLNRNRQVTHRQLIGALYQDNTRNPEGALKNLMYRVRNELKLFGDEKFICTSSGAYQWNPEIAIESDYEHFELLASELRMAETEEQREQLCRELVQHYRGNVTARIADEEWILPRKMRYESIYIDAVKQLCIIYEHQKNWVDMENVCMHALIVDSLDEEVHCSLIRSLYEQKKYDQALSQYKKADRLFYETMGIRNSEKLQKVFRGMMTETGEKTKDIHEILDDVREQEDPDGAFLCDYQIFRQIYRMEMRRIDRLGIAEYTLLITLQRNNSVWQSASIDRGLIEGMDILESVIRKSMRMGDVATRYGTSQFIILLPTCTYESGVKVAQRIQRNFQASIGNKKLELVYELSETLPI